MHKNKCKKIVIGAGGGYDIVVAAMIRNRILRHNSDEIAVGGFLNPKFTHIYDNGSDHVVESAVNLVKSARKYRITLDEYTSEKSYDCNKEEAVHFVDQKLSEVLDCSVYNFSLNYEAEQIAVFLVENYDEIYLCDVGGDILFFGREDSSVKTPIIDAFSLIVARKCYELAEKKCQLILVGIGLDGELGKINISRNLASLENEAAVLGVEDICSLDIEYLEKVYNGVRITNKGKTNQLLIDIWNDKNLEKNPLVIKRNILNFKEWFNKIYIVDALAVHRHNPLCSYKNIDEMKKAAAELGVELQ